MRVGGALLVLLLLAAACGGDDAGSATISAPSTTTPTTTTTPQPSVLRSAFGYRVPVPEGWIATEGTPADRVLSPDRQSSLSVESIDVGVDEVLDLALDIEQRASLEVEPGCARERSFGEVDGRRALVLLSRCAGDLVVLRAILLDDGRRGFVITRGPEDDIATLATLDELVRALRVVG